MAEAFKFELVSPARLILSEEVEEVVVPGAEGYFTVLKGHAPFLSTIRPGVLAFTGKDGKVARLFIAGGFADVSPTGLTVLAEQAIPVEEFGTDVIARQVADAEAGVKAARSDEAKRIAQEKLDQLKEAVVEIGLVSGSGSTH
ncbi:MAG: F0F1 ATP synthase subunit epsilon [Ancalomicrobiaceae bacterium]|nr:F0F1 ATP synthase subunit epsilon [Ancalomicrobiaceae bacterium]